MLTILIIVLLALLLVGYGGGRYGRWYTVPNRDPLVIVLIIILVIVLLWALGVFSSGPR